MTSILTNVSAMGALATLRSIGSSLESTQARVSSGYKVGVAADNAAYWSIATTMRSDSKALGTVSEALGLGAAKTDTAYTGMNSAISVITEIKAKLVAAREPGVDKGKINKELTELKAQLVSVAKSAGFSGENWLYNDSATQAGTKDVVGSFNRDANNNVSIGLLSFNTANSILIDKTNAQWGLLTQDVIAKEPGVTAGTTVDVNYFLIKAGSATTAAGNEISISTLTTNVQLASMQSVVESILGKMTDAASTLGATTSRIKLQDDFVNNLQQSLDKGIGRLVDADMNDESTRLKALQTQEQLGIQALTIANSGPQNILALFR